MLVQQYYGFWEETWINPQKVTFDGPNKIIVINPDIYNIDVQFDIYSAWKEWMLSDEHENAAYPQAMRSVGGDPTVNGEYLGATFFLMNGWRIRTWEGDHRLVVKGNLYTEEGESPFVPTIFPHNINIESQVSSINTAIEPAGGIPTADEIATEVWSTAPAEETKQEIAAEVWATAPAQDIDAIVQGIWDELMSEHNIPGSFGKRIREILPTLWGIK